MNQEHKSFAAAMKSYFALLPGQSLLAFREELKRLTHDEKVEFAHMLNAAGYPSEMPSPAKEPAT